MRCGSSRTSCANASVACANTTRRARCARRSCHFDAKHHAAVLMLEVVAMEHVRLLAGKRQREVDRDLHALAWPDQHRVLPSKVGRQPPALIDLERRDLIGTGL